MKKTAVIVAGGSSIRINSGIPKQFMLLRGKPVLTYALNAFNAAFPGIDIVLVLPEGYFQYWTDLCLQYAFNLRYTLVAGGETRFHSVRNALAVTQAEGLVAIHDGARPLVSPDLIQQAFKAALHYGNCIPVVPVNESLRFSDGESNKPVDRHQFFLVQTPQIFRVEAIRNAYQQPFSEKYTDDAMVLENTGVNIHLIPGETRNLKITVAEDLLIAEALIKNEPH